MSRLTVIILSLCFLASCSANSNPFLGGVHLHAMTMQQSALQADSDRVKRQSATEILIECTKIALEYQCTSGYTQGRIMEALMCRNESAARLMAQGCAKNEQGEYCALSTLTLSQPLTRVLTHCGNAGINCSDECSDSLESLKNTLGCCLNSIYNTTANPAYGIIQQYLSYSLWQRCNVVPHSACTNGLAVPQAPSNAQTCTLEQYSRRITEYDCSSSNGRPLVNRILRDNRCTDYAKSVVDACAINSNGQYCSEVLSNDIISGGADSSFTSLLTNCYTITSCTPSCRMSIEDAKSSYGCCLGATNRSLNALGVSYPPLSYTVWNSCGVNPPEAQCASTLTDHAAHVKDLGWVISIIAVLAMIFN